MGKFEFIIIGAMILVGVAAFGMEDLPAGTVRVIAIGFCLTLIALLIVGMFMRARAKRRRAAMMYGPAATQSSTKDPS